MHKITKYQAKVLLKNPNVVKVTTSHVVYTAKFKVQCVKRGFAGVPGERIFEEAGIPIQFFKKNYTKYCLKRWRKKYQEEGVKSFDQERRGAPSVPKLGIDLTYEELLAVVKIQREVIEELKKRKALVKKKSK